MPEFRSFCVFLIIKGASSMLKEKTMHLIFVLHKFHILFSKPFILGEKATNIFFGFYILFFGAN
jgi:hypothetical protein